jgi:pentatricopeptide repeat protein
MSARVEVEGVGHARESECGDNIINIEEAEGADRERLDVVGQGGGLSRSSGGWGEGGKGGGQEEEVGIIRVMASSRNLEGALEVVKNMRAQGREPSRQVEV